MYIGKRRDGGVTRRSRGRGNCGGIYCLREESNFNNKNSGITVQGKKLFILGTPLSVVLAYNDL